MQIQEVQRAAGKEIKALHAKAVRAEERAARSEQQLKKMEAAQGEAARAQRVLEERLAVLEAANSY